FPIAGNRGPRAVSEAPNSVHFRWRIHMRRVAVWLATLVLCLGLAGVAEAKKKSKSKKKLAKKASSRCIKTDTGSAEAELWWTFTSDCDREVVCSARWVLTCGDKPTEDGAKDESVTVAPGESITITASATECGEEWA